MTDITNEFFNEVKATQMLWGLQDISSEGWVIVDSVNFEDSETMPLWSTESGAQAHCTEEWAQYTPIQISVSDWLEFWVEDLAEDKVLIGVDWQDEQECIELELGDFSQKVADIEKLS